VRPRKAEVIPQQWDTLAKKNTTNFFFSLEVKEFLENEES